LEATRVLDMPEARRFALRSLDRMLSEVWKPTQGLQRIVAYSDPEADHRHIDGVLDDYAFMSIACLDAYEATADVSYFKFAHSIADLMIQKFYDSVGAGFFDTPPSEDTLGVLGSRRKPFQDSPTPAANSVAAIALLRLHSYTNEEGYRDKAEDTLELLTNTAEQYGIFAASYGIAAVYFSQPPTQVAVTGKDQRADQLYAAAIEAFAFNKAVIRFSDSELSAPNLPPALAETLPNVPGASGGAAMAIVCSGFACQPPISDPGQLSATLREPKPVPR
jgi:uncharacterized protein YyaL (SSP411 family)